MGQGGGGAVPSSVTEIVLAGETPVLLAMADLMLAGMKGSGGKADSVSLAAVADNTSGMLGTTVPSSDPAAADVVSVANLEFGIFLLISEPVLDWMAAKLNISSLAEKVEPAGVAS